MTARAAESQREIVHPVLRGAEIKEGEKLNEQREHLDSRGGAKSPQPAVSSLHEQIYKYEV